MITETCSTVDVGGCLLHVDMRGVGVPVVLIHGTAPSLWGKTFDLFSQTNQVVCYERRGFGLSRHEPIAELSTHVSDAETLIRQLDLVPATLVGWSMGGIIALELAIVRPNLVKSLVLLEPPFQIGKRPPLRAMKAIFMAKFWSAFGCYGRAGEAFLRWALRYREGGTALDNLDPQERAAIVANGRAIARELDASTGEHLTQEMLSRIVCPVTLLVGDRSDPSFTKAADRLRVAIPKAMLRTIRGAGHDLQLTHPQSIADAVHEM